MKSRVFLRMAAAAAAVLAVDMAEKALRKSGLTGRNRDTALTAIRAAVPAAISIAVRLLSDDEPASGSDEQQPAGASAR